MVIVLLFIAAGSFPAGAWVYHVSSRGKPGERKILYYVDSMNPAYKSDKPGLSPGCGMPLDPVYAIQNGLATNGSNSLKSMPHQ